MRATRAGNCVFVAPASRLRCQALAIGWWSKKPSDAQVNDRNAQIAIVHRGLCEGPISTFCRPIAELEA